MKHPWIRIVAALFVGTVFSTLVVPQTAETSQTRGPYARIAIMRALDESHSVDFEAGYIRHLEWHRQAKDTFGWYSYSVWASTERQRWILYATFGHTATELSNPVSPTEDEKDTIINLLPHVQFLGNGVYEFLPSLSRGNGVPTPTPRAEYTTVELNYGTARAFEAALSAEQPKLQGETLWYRLVVGGNVPRYVRLRPRASLASILDQRGDQTLPDKVNGLISKMSVETLNLRPNMLVNITPEPVRLGGGAHYFIFRDWAFAPRLATWESALVDWVKTICGVSIPVLAFAKIASEIALVTALVLLIALV